MVYLDKKGSLYLGARTPKQPKDQGQEVAPLKVRKPLVRAHTPGHCQKCNQYHG